MSLSIVKIENPFDRTKRIVDNCPHTGENLSSIIKQRIPDDVGVMVSVNGGIVPKDKWDDFCPADGEMVLMVPVIEGGDDKGILIWLRCWL